MDLNKFIAICVFYAIMVVKLVITLPTFGSEIVRIKVHLPDEQTIQSIMYDASKHHESHKIIHHYRSSIKKFSDKEAIPYLTQRDKHYGQDILYQSEETFLVKDKLDSNKKVVEEYQQHVENFKNHRENIKLIGNSDHQHHEDLDYAVETVAHGIEEKPQYLYNQKNHIADDYNPSKDQVIKIIEAPKYTVSGHDAEIKQIMFNDSNNHNQLLHEKSLEFIKHQQPKIESHYQVQYEYLKSKEQVLAEFQEEYHINPKHTKSKYPHEEVPIVTIDDIEYEQTKEKCKKDMQNVECIVATHSEPKLLYATHSLDAPHLSASTTNDEINNKYQYQRNYQKQLETFENSQDCKESNIMEEHLCSEENPNAKETYSGYDSYNAGHAQGVGSGSYHYHKSIMINKLTETISQINCN